MKKDGNRVFSPAVFSPVKNYLPHQREEMETVCTGIPKKRSHPALEPMGQDGVKMKQAAYSAESKDSDSFDQWLSESGKQARQQLAVGPAD